MEKSFLSREWIMLLALLLPFLYIAIVWNQIPGSMPTHFNIEGKPDDYSSKQFGAFLLPSMNVFIYLVLLFIPRIDPRYSNYAKFRKAYTAIRLVIHLFFSILSVMIVQSAVNSAIFSIQFIPVFAFLMIAIIGYYMPKVESNFFVGIRTPWTLSNEEVWKKTHELGGKIFLFTGSVTCILLLVIPMEYSLWIIFPAILFLILVPVIYSYIEYRKTQRKA